MSKRIVIIPNFGESHFIKYQIPNLVDTLNPDIVIYNEGLFPKGPESKTNINNDFKEKYCYQNTNLAWDTLETQLLIKDASTKYPNTKWIYNEMKFPKDMSASEAYTYAVSNWDELGIQAEIGDYIFPYEPDIFHLESDKDNITYLLDQLKPNQGFTSVWLDFLETQNYIETINNPFIGRSRGRKIALQFGGLDFYKQVVGQFENQNYNMLYSSDLMTYHYNWFRFDKNKQLRYDQIVREKKYWEDFETGLKEIKFNTINKINKDVIMRPSKQENDPMKYASYIDIQQPKAIQNHPNFIK
jgi:hypothetical protein